MSLTQVRELDREILMKMDDLTLGQACQVNQWLEQICSDDFFWKERLQRRFGDEIVALKSRRETYYGMYVRLAQLEYSWNQTRMSAQQGHLDELILLARAGMPPDRDELWLAIGYGYLDIVKWILTHVDPADIGLEDAMLVAAASNQLAVMKWLNERYTGLITPDVVQEAFEKGGPQILDWLSQLGYVPSAQDMREAVFSGNIPAIDWLIQRNIWPSQQDLTSAVHRGTTKILEHIYRRYNRLPHLTQADINDAAVNNNLETLDWLEQHGLGWPDREAVEQIEGRIAQNAALGLMDRETMTEWYQSVLDWLAERGI